MKLKFSLLVLVLIGLGLLWRQRSASRDNQSKNEIPTPAANLADQAQSNSKPQSANETRKPAAAGNTDKLEQWLAAYQSKSGLHIRTGPAGQVTTVTGIKYPTQWKTAQDGLPFAKKFATSLDIPDDQIVTAPAAPPETDVNEVFRYSQVFAGYPVFAGFLQVTQSKATGDSYLIGNELRSLGTPILENNFSSSQIEGFLKGKFGEGIEILPERNGQQIFSTAPGASELSWAFSVELYKPGRDRRFVLVSAKDGRILFDQSLVVH